MSETNFVDISVHITTRVVNALEQEDAIDRFVEQVVKIAKDCVPHSSIEISIDKHRRVTSST